VDLIRARVAPCLILTGLLAALGHAQAPLSSPATSSGSPTSSSAAKASSPAERVVLKVGNAEVTQADFESRISDIEPQGDPDKEGPADKDRRKLGDDYASVLMLSQQAVATHLDASPQVSRQLAIDRLQVLSDAEFAKLMEQAKPSSEEISQYYSAHPSDFEEVRILRLFIWKRGGDSKNTRGLSPQEARSRADAILQASAAGRDTTKLTEGFKDSDDGMFDARPFVFPRGELPPRMEKVAFAIKDGEWSEVEDTPNSIILIRLVKRGRQPLEEVSSLIEKEVQSEKMQTMLDDLKKNAGIWMDKEYFGTAVAPVPGAQRRISNPPSKLQESAKKGESNHEDERPK
jgi:parvulin-like peptidyl-prolyl isomerase